MVIARRVILAGLGAALAGCQSVELPSEQRTDLEWRRVTAPSGVVFDAALETLFDQGYLIRLCDRRSGTVVGRLPVRQPRGLRDSRWPYQAEWDARREAGNDLTIVAEPGKREIRVTAMSGGRPEERRVAAFYAALGEKVKLEPWASPPRAPAERSAR